MTSYDLSTMPSYRSHKVVRAVKIESVDTSYQRLFVDGGKILKLDPEYFQRHMPEAGGYFVLYEDSYQSYSPAKAFEDGYTTM
jgi:hypothetical protein